MVTTARAKVLLLIPNFGTGGAERVFLTLIRQLDRSRYDLTVGILQRTQVEHGADIPKDVPVEVLGVDRARYAIPKIVSLIRRIRPGLVFCTTNELNMVMSLVAAVRHRSEVYVAREPNIASVHNRMLPNAGLRIAFSKRMYRYFRTIVCQTTAMKEDFIAEWGLPQRQLEVIHNPVDLERIYALAGAPLDLSYLPAGAVPLVAAGRLSVEKDFATLLDALALCDDKRLHLSILGTGPLEQSLRTQTQALGIADRVHFPGFVENPYPYFRMARCLVVSSLYEGMPNVALEALASDTPVLAFAKVNGLDDLVQSCRGIQLVSERSASALAEHLRLLLSQPDKPKVNVSALAATQIVQSYSALFDRLLMEN